jgi:hypothetical protein
MPLGERYVSTTLILRSVMLVIPNFHNPALSRCGISLGFLPNRFSLSGSAIWLIIILLARNGISNSLALWPHKICVVVEMIV